MNYTLFRYVEYLYIIFVVLCSFPLQNGIVYQGYTKDIAQKQQHMVAAPLSQNRNLPLCKNCLIADQL